MQKIILRFVVIVAMVMLGGCATAPGQFNGLGTDPMGMMVVYRSDDRQLTRDALDIVRKEAERMVARVGIQLSSPLEAGFTSGVFNAAGGVLDAAGASYGVVGVLTGLAAYSYSMVYVISEATEYRLRFLERMNDAFKEIHVSPAFVRSDPSKAVTVAPK